MNSIGWCNRVWVVSGGDIELEAIQAIFSVSRVSDAVNHSWIPKNHEKNIPVIIFWLSFLHWPNHRAIFDILMETLSHCLFLSRSQCAFFCTFLRNHVSHYSSSTVSVRRLIRWLWASLMQGLVSSLLQCLIMRMHKVLISNQRTPLHWLVNLKFDIVIQW